MEGIISSIVTAIGTIAAVLITQHYAKNKRQDLLSEDIEETVNADGSTSKKTKRKFK